MSALVKKPILLLQWILLAFCYLFSVSVAAITELDAIVNDNAQFVKTTIAHTPFAANSPVLVFVDTKLDNVQALVKDIENHGATKNITIVYLDPEQNGVQKITDTLANQTDVAAIHLLTHGMAGSIQLGNAVLNQNTVDLYASQLSAWKKSLSANADILIYGCNVTSTDAGLKFIKQIGELTEAHIAASTNPTGAVSLGADWNLESHYGTVKTHVLISAQTQQSWNSVLAYTNYISIGAGAVDQTFTASSNVGTGFSYDSPGATYSVTRVSVRLKILAGADTTKTITLCVRTAWNNSTGEKCGSMATTSLTTSYAWYGFNLSSAATLNDNQKYYIQIYTLSTDAKTVAGIHNSSQWNNDTELMVGVTPDASKELSFILSGGTNTTPVVNSAIPDQAGTENVAFSFTFSATAFTDADTGDLLTYTATLSSNAALPAWLSFNASTRTFSGTPLTANVGTIAVKVTASDGTATIHDTFDLVIASNLSYYRISHSSPGVTCAGSAITISAYNAANALVAPANGTTITLSTSPATGTWVGGNTAAFDGVVTSVTKYLQQTTASTLNINVTDGTHTESASYDPDITFNAAALTFYGSTGLGAMPNQVAGTADTAPIIKVNSCATQVTGAKNVSFGYECRNPTTCVVGQTLSVNSNNIQSNANGATITYSAAQSLTFDGSGIASIPINYSDVGQVKIYATMTLAASGNDPAITLTGNSGDFVVKPHTLVATAIQTAAAVANPGGSSTSGAAAGFVSAGTAFTTKVEVRNAAGNRTPNFGNETSTQNNLQFVPQSLVYPVGGTLTALTNPAAFTATTPAGTFINTTMYWDQVGSFTARPELADNDYLGAGDVVAKTTSGTIGRFYPDHFALVAGSTATNSCGTFSYLSHPAIGLSYTLQARGASNTVLTNYGGNYALAAQAAPSYIAENSNGGNGATFTSRLFDGATPGWSNGVMAVASSAAYVSRVLTTYAPDGPYTSLQWGLTLSESFDGGRSLTGTDMNALTTGVCGGACTAVAIGSPISLRYGRLRLEGASGPETAVLPVNFFTEYWTGTSYNLNTLDSCTLLPRSTITYTPVTPTPGGGGTLSTDANRTVAMAATKTTTGIYTNLDGSGVHFTAGKAGHYFTAPGAGGVGSFTEGVNLTTLPWLRFDWNQNGDFSDTSLPNATFTFGTYRGNDRIIYWHEKL